MNEEGYSPDHDTRLDDLEAMCTLYKNRHQAQTQEITLLRNLARCVDVALTKGTRIEGRIGDLVVTALSTWKNTAYVDLRKFDFEDMTYGDIEAALREHRDDTVPLAKRMRRFEETPRGICPPPEEWVP